MAALVLMMQYFPSNVNRIKKVSKTFTNALVKSMFLKFTSANKELYRTHFTLLLNVNLSGEPPAYLITTSKKQSDFRRFQMISTDFS